MVRTKHRYLLLQILYPSGSPTTTSRPPQKTAASSILPYYAPTPDSINAGAFIRLVRAHIETLFGDLGAATAGSSGLKLVYWSNATSTALLRCRRESVRLVWAAVTLIRSLLVSGGPSGPSRGRAHPPPASSSREEVECVIRVVRVSGTIKKAEEEILRRARALVGRVRALSMMQDAGAELSGLVGDVEVSDEEDEGPSIRGQDEGTGVSGGEDLGEPVSLDEVTG